MWEEPIVQQRVKSALNEGITSQSASRAKQGGESFVMKVINALRRIFVIEKQAGTDTRKSLRYRESQEI